MYVQVLLLVAKHVFWTGKSLKVSFECHLFSWFKNIVICKQTDLTFSSLSENINRTFILKWLTGSGKCSFDSWVSADPDEHRASAVCSLERGGERSRSRSALCWGPRRSFTSRPWTCRSSRPDAPEREGVCSLSAGQVQVSRWDWGLWSSLSSHRELIRELCCEAFRGSRSRRHRSAASRKKHLSELPPPAETRASFQMLRG